jgi:hypothetical protein
VTDRILANLKEVFERLINLFVEKFLPSFSIIFFILHKVFGLEIVDTELGESVVRQISQYLADMPSLVSSFLGYDVNMIVKS